MSRLDCPSNSIACTNLETFLSHASKYHIDSTLEMDKINQAVSSKTNLLG